jgi:CheY-like chemotaxis protein
VTAPTPARQDTVLEGTTGAPGSGPPGGSRHRDERVLLVDDREDNLMALEAALEPLGYPLFTARSGAEALRFLLETDVSAVVLDVQMPDMDGFETATLLKSREATRTIPILFLTAVGLSLEHELRGYEVGGSDYICKPFEPRVLQAKVRAAVRWNAELRAVRRASRVYQEAEEALSSFRSEPAPPVDRRRRDGGDRMLSQPVATARLLDLELGASLSSPAKARAMIRDALVGQEPDRVDVVVLLVSELLANAVVHAESATRLRLDAGEGLIRVEVEDAADEIPDPMLAGAEAEGGRGWLMVEQLADRCGWNRLARGKTVWFELGR